ncbi:MAG: hypothetical protein WKF84_12795 [Pyrinomonadaceae bacterium]
MSKPPRRKFLKMLGLSSATVLTAPLSVKVGGAPLSSSTARDALVLNPDAFRAQLGDEDEAAWLKRNVPFFECPDAAIQEIYYYRWRVFRKHIKHTPDGFIVTEFLPPVEWAGKHNSICCPAGHQFREGRWLHNQKYLDDYAVFWFRKGGEPRRYSFWAADSIYAKYLVDDDSKVVMDLLPDLMDNYRAWEKTNLDASGLFHQYDNRDGMEYSIGSGGYLPDYRQRKPSDYRPTINSYMYGDAAAIAKIAALAKRRDVASEYRQKAAKIKCLVQSVLWDKNDNFFKALPREKSSRLADVREQIGYVPWYFNLPDAGYEVAWKQLIDPNGFEAPFGPTTAERRHPKFMFEADHPCLWNGPSWPFATTQTLVALANLLNDYQQPHLGKRDYLKLLQTYARSQHITLADGKTVTWIDEDLHPDTGEWIARKWLYERNDPLKDRGQYYNHSGYCDLVISGLIGIRPRSDSMLEVNPLVPDQTWDYFALDRVPYHGRMLSVLYDRTGERYRRGRVCECLWTGGKSPSQTRFKN